MAEHRDAPLRRRRSYVVHPLYDAKERKRDPEKVGPMKMTPKMRYALLVLRGYLIFLILLAAYRAIEMALSAHLDIQ